MRNTTSPSRRPLASSLAKLPSAAAICAVIALASTGSATDYYWDGDGSAAGNDTTDGTNLGGSGIWTPTGGTNWFNGTDNGAWPNLTPNADKAIFTGLGTEVSLGGSVFVNTLQFDSNGYLITNGGTVANVLTLSGTSPTVQVTNSAHSAVISAVVAGDQGLTKTGAGTLTLGGGNLDTTANTFTGTLTLSAGTLRLDKAAGTLATASTNLQLNAGTVFFGSSSNLLASNQLSSSANVTVAGATLNFHAGTGTSAANQTLNSLTVNSGTINTTTGTFTDVSALNTINVTNAFNVTGGTTTLNSGTVLNAGSFTISGGTLMIGGNTALRNTVFAPGAVNLNGGTIQMNYGTATGAQRGEFRLSSDVNVGGTAATSVTRSGSGTVTSEPAIVLGDAARVFNVADSNSAGTDLTIGVRVDGGGIVKRGAGTMLLNSTASPFTGDILIEQGTLAFTGTGGSADQTALGAGAKTITLTNNATLALVSANADPNVAGGKGFVIGTGGGTINVASGLTFTINDGVSNGSAQNQLQGSGLLTKTGTGILNLGLDFTSTFSGDVNVTQGRLDIASSGAAGSVGTITVDGTAGARLNLNRSTSFALTNNVVLKNGAVLSTQGASQNVQNSQTITIGAGTNRIRVDDGALDTVSGTNRTFVLNGALSGDAANTLVVTGPSGTSRGVLALSNAAGNFAGTIIIDKNVSLENFARWNGTTATNTGKTIGTALIKFAAVPAGEGGSASTVDGQLDLRDSGTGNNQVLTYGNNIDMSATGGTIAVGTNTQQIIPSTGNRFVLGTLTVGADNTVTVNGTNGYALEFAGPTTLAGSATFGGTGEVRLGGGLTGGVNLTRTGTGRLVLPAPTGVTYTGTTTITSGGVVFETLSAIGGTGQSITLGSGGYVGANFEITQANLINRLVGNTNTGVVALGVSSAESLDFTALTNTRLGSIGNVTYTGTLVQVGTALFGGGGGTLILPNNDVISGTRNLDIGTSGTPAGIVALDGTNSFTGAITISGGQLLRPASNASLGDAANAINSTGGGIQLKAGAGFDVFAARQITFGTGGFTLDTNGNDLTTTAALGLNGDGTFTKIGVGKLTLTQASTYKGGTNLFGGTLSIAADNMLGTAATAIQLQNGSTLEVTGTTAMARAITVANGGGTISVSAGNTLTLSASTAGTGLFIKEGAGTLLITADPNNNNTNNLGGFFVNGGVLALQHSTGSTDAPFTIANGGTLQVLATNDLGDAYSVTVNEGGVFDLRASDQISQLFGTGVVKNDGAAATTLTVSSSSDATFGGVMQNGASTLNFTKSGSSIVTLTGTNTYTGTTTINNGPMVVSGQNGAITGSATINVGDNNGGGESLIVGALDDVVTVALNRLTDSGNLVLNGSSTGGFTYNGPAAGSTGNVETIGTLTASNGRNTFTINPGTGNEVQITTGSLARANAGTLVLRGSNLGGTGVGSTRLLVTGTVPLAGADGADGTTTKSIIPFAIGDNSNTGAGTGFLTHNATTGVRLLTNAEYDSTIAGLAELRNVSTSGGETVSSDVRINSLRLTGTAPTTIAAGTRVAVNSGAILFTDSSTIAGPGTLDFGAVDGIIHLAKNTVGGVAAINANLAGSAGLTLGVSSDVNTGVITLGGDNSVIGNLTINQGTVNLTSSTALNDQIPMTVILRPNTAFGLNGNSVTVRDLQASSGTGTFQNGSTTAATLTTYLTGNRSIQTVLQNGGSGALNLVVSGGNTLTVETDSSATGTFEQRNGVTALTTNNGTLNDFTSYAINGGTLRLTNASGSANGNRLRDASAISMNSGTLDFDNNASAAAFSETVGAITLAGGANTITVDKGASTTNTSVLTATSLTRSSGATLNLTSQNNGAAIFDLGTAANSRLVFSTAPSSNAGIIGGWATIDSSANTREFVKYVSSGTISATALATADYTTSLTSGAKNTQNVKITATPAALTSDTQINSLNMAQASASTVDIGAGNTLRVETGGIIVSGAFNAAFTNGTLTAGIGTAGGDLIVHALPISSSGLSWVNSSDTITLANVANGTPVVFATAPGGLTPGITYYAVGATSTNFKVAASPGGAAINITSDGNNAALSLLTNSTSIGSVIANNGAGVVNLVKAGGGILTLTGTNTYTGKTYLNGGMLRITDDSNLGTAPAAPVADSLVLSGGSVVDLSTSVVLNQNRGIRVGAGTNTFAIASGTAGNGKTLTYNGAISSFGTTEGSLQFRSNAIATAGVDPGKVSANLTGLSLNGSLRVDAGTVTSSAVGNSIGRSLQLGMDGSASLTFTNAGGSLTVGKGINDVLELGVNSSDVLSTVGTLDVSALANFTANVDTIRLGIGAAGQTGRGILNLAVNNDISAGTSILIGNSGGVGQEAIESSIKFGAGISNVTTKTFTVGGLKGNGSATIVAGGTVNLNGFGGNTLDLYVARNSGSTGTVARGTFDPTGGTVKASLNNLVVGEKTGGSVGGANGIFKLAGANSSISANAVTVGSLNGNSGTGTAVTQGLLDISAGSLVVNNDLSIALWNSGGSQTSAGTVNITGGNVTVGGNITTTDSASATSTLNLKGGSLNMTGGNINVDAFNAQTGILENVGQIFNGDGVTPAALTKNGVGVLELKGANMFTGGVNVFEGTLYADGTVNGPVTTSTSTTFGGNALLNGSLTLGNGSTLKLDLTGVTGYDQITMGSTGGLVSLGTDVNLSISLGFTPDTSVDTFYYILNRADSGTYANTFAGLPEGAYVDLGNGVFGKLTYQANWMGSPATSSITGGNDVAITIPEPGTVVTLFGGIGALLGMGRFRRRAARA